MSLKEFSADTGTAIADDLVEDQFAVLELARIAPSLTNPRKTFNEAKLADLAESIKASGVHQPILVRKLPPARMDDTFRNRGDGNPLPTHEIVSGERRYRASKLAGATTIPAMIRALSDADVLEIQIVENLQRDDLTELEEAEGYQRLCEETGLQKEQIGERIGKSRAYVYARLKLLDLTTGPREALRKGDIDASKALLIARIPDEKLQVKALEAATEKDHQGSPRLSYRALQTWVQQNVMLKLSSARFSIIDASLVPAAGACPACPKRTGANPDLFSDVDGPDVCIDPACFHGKEAAHTAQLVEVARAKGVTIIEGREAKEIKPSEHYSRLVGYESLDDTIYHAGAMKPLRELLTAKELKRSAMLVDPSTGELIEVVPDEVASTAKARARQATVTPKERKADAEYEAEQERRNLELDYQKRWRTAAIATIRPRIEAGEICTMTAGLMRRILLDLSGVDQRCRDEDAASALGLLEQDQGWDDQLVASTLRATDDNEVGFKLLVTLLLSDSVAYSTWVDGQRVADDSAPVIEELAGILDVSIADIKAKVKAEIRAERAPDASARDDLAAPAEGSAKGGKKSKPAARATKAKTSPEEASASIAAALQELDAGPAGAPVVLGAN